MTLKLFLLVLCLGLISCIVPESLKEQRAITKRAIESSSYISQPHYLESDGFRFHYRKVGTAKEGVVVWIHGTPGGWDDGIRLMVDKDFTSSIQFVGIDRPGWGESQYHSQPRVVSSFEEQGRHIARLLEHLKKENPEIPLVLIGHSWGGSLAPAIALGYPHLVDGIVIAAGGIDPELTRPRWYNRLGNTWAIHAFLGDSMRAANVEIYSLASELQKLKPRWSELVIPVIAIQGKEDRLVDPGNADFVEEYFPEAFVLRLENQGHLLQAERPELLGRCIRAMLKNDLSDCKEH